MKGKAGRKSIDGATAVTERVNIMLTKEHRERLEMLATAGYSCWMRAAIDKEWAKHMKENRK